MAGKLIALRFARKVVGERLIEARRLLHGTASTGHVNKPNGSLGCSAIWRACRKRNWKTSFAA